MNCLEVSAITTGPKHHFFGYYDKFPWNVSGRFLLGLETGFMERRPTAEDAAVIGMVDLHAANRWLPLAETRAWNWQQGAMLQWLGGDAERTIVYNVCADGCFAAVVHDVQSGARRCLPRAVYALSRDGCQAVSLNFARLASTRPGYGYEGVADPWAEQLHPDGDGLYWMDMRTGENRLVVSLAQVVGIGHTAEMDGAKHWFNHVQFNPSGRRFLFLHRWVSGQGRRRTRLFTADPDGGALHCVSDHDMVSHFDWQDDRHILAWARRHGIGERFFVFEDQGAAITVLGDGVLTQDGHCSYSPNGGWISTDTYPDREGMRTLILYDVRHKRRIDIGRFFARPEQITDAIRCDLHPRWNRVGDRLCFDSVHEGTRQIYVIDVRHVVAG